MKTITSLAQYNEVYQKSIHDPSAFWADIANEFKWRKPFEKVLEGDFSKEHVKWFVGGKLNITENALDRHLLHHADKVALIWESNDPAEPAKTYTYKELHNEVARFATVLKKYQIKKGDRVCLYLPMVPELAIAVLACARIGAVHSVVFAGFSAQALADRIEDSDCKLVITADGAFRGTKPIALKPTVDRALETCPSVKRVIIVRRTFTSIDYNPDRDSYWDTEMGQTHELAAAEEMDAEDMLFILYTSGSTGKPKGVVHTCGGYMVYTAYTFQQVFQYNRIAQELQTQPVFWCTADIGWVTGHSYAIYGPLLSGATTLLFEGIPTHPHPGRFWEVIDKHKVVIFYTAPTAIRSLQSLGTQPLEPYQLDSLKVLGSVGEPINEEAWNWYNTHVGKGKCPIVDTWWQTETGGIMISPLAGITPTKPGFATLPLPGVDLVLVDNEGNELHGNGVDGNLCIRSPWPSILRTTYGDHKRYLQTYFGTYKKLYFTGDGCRRDEQGYYRITGRVDDVINISGHRIGTAEVENAINLHPDIIESAVVGFPHDIKGQGLYAYVISSNDLHDPDLLKAEIIAIVNREIGPIAKPDKVQIVRGLPKTRSGKIMRRILRKIAEGQTSDLGDTTTLLDPSIVDEILSKRL